ncbi:MAG: hypothetical protein WBJ40_03080, partial [Methanoculleus sp.]
DSQREESCPGRRRIFQDDFTEAPQICPSALYGSGIASRGGWEKELSLHLSNLPGMAYSKTPRLPPQDHHNVQVIRRLKTPLTVKLATLMLLASTGRPAIAERAYLPGV